jgi:6-phospho-3-hexuloisomerase
VTPPAADGFRTASGLILGELGGALGAVAPEQVQRLVEALATAGRIVLVGAGRMGIVLQAFCMRLGHLGCDAHMAGALGCPPIAAGDLLLVASSSGETATVCALVRRAREQGATIAAITASPASTVGRAAALAVLLHAPAALQANASAAPISAQPMKTLFEQCLFLLLESVVLLLMTRTGQTAGDLATRHTNLE